MPAQVLRTDIEFVASGPKTPKGAASIVESEAIRKQVSKSSRPRTFDVVQLQM